MTSSTPPVLGKEENQPGQTPAANEGVSGEIAQRLLIKQDIIPLPTVDIDGEEAKFSLHRYTLDPEAAPPTYFLYINNKDAEWYAQDDCRTLEGGKGFDGKDDIDIDVEQKLVYVRNGVKYWEIYDIKEVFNHGTYNISLVRKGRIPYSPLKPTTKTRLVGRRENITLVEYTNPPESGHIDPNHYKPTDGKMLIIPNRYKESSKTVEFPYKEGISFDESTIEYFDFDSELRIRDTTGKEHRYHINVVNPELQELHYQ